ncbi:helix-turn-helix transcriptional regulator [Rathayibacter oskolensis]|uniref:helix-turn-helix transcriptional regulator n=1 Tax=Rathayibacter oskolensis TaxID=1891671 RepID=UPI003466582D
MRRDIDRLRELGYRIRAIKGPDGGYRLEAGSELPPLLFDDEQALALAAALQAVPVAGLEEASARALAAVRQVLPERLRHRLDALRFTTVAPEAPAVAPEVLVAVTAAVRAREVLRFDYGSAEAPRRVEPHHLVSREGRWYLVGWDLDRDDWRVFRVDRVAPGLRGARASRAVACPEAASRRSSTPGSRAARPAAAGRARGRDAAAAREPGRALRGRRRGRGSRRGRVPALARGVDLGGARRVVRAVRRRDDRGGAGRARRGVRGAGPPVRRGGRGSMRV